MKAPATQTKKQETQQKTSDAAH